MTIEDMRSFLGLGPDVADAAVIAAYGAALAAEADEPLSLADAKLHLRVDAEDEDDLILGCIAASVDQVERYTGLVLTRRLVTEALSHFGDRIRSWPVVRVLSVIYLDAGGDQQEINVADLRVNCASRPLRLFPATRWPCAAQTAAPVTVVLEAGFAAEDVPPTIRQALKLLTGHFYSNRLAVEVQNSVVAVEVPMAVSMLLRSHRRRVL